MTAVNHIVIVIKSTDAFSPNQINFVEDIYDILKKFNILF